MKNIRFDIKRLGFIINFLLLKRHLFISGMLRLKFLIELLSFTIPKELLFTVFILLISFSKKFCSFELISTPRSKLKVLVSI